MAYTAHRGVLCPRSRVKYLQGSPQYRMRIIRTFLYIHTTDEAIANTANALCEYLSHNERSFSQQYILSMATTGAIGICADARRTLTGPMAMTMAVSVFVMAATCVYADVGWIYRTNWIDQADNINYFLLPLAFQAGAYENNPCQDIISLTRLLHLCRYVCGCGVVAKHTAHAPMQSYPGPWPCPLPGPFRGPPEAEAVSDSYSGPRP